MAVPKFTIKTIPVPRESEFRGQGLGASFFITCDGESAIIDPLKCPSCTSAYANAIKASGTELKYIFQTSTRGVAPAAHNSGGGRCPDPADHTDLSILTNATIVFGPNSSMDFGASNVTPASDEEEFRLGSITFTVMLHRDSTTSMTPAEDEAHCSCCCFLLKDESHTPVALFSGNPKMITPAKLKSERMSQMPDELVIYTAGGAMAVDGDGIPTLGSPGIESPLLTSKRKSVSTSEPVEHDPSEALTTEESIFTLGMLRKVFASASDVQGEEEIAAEKKEHAEVPIDGEANEKEDEEKEDEKPKTTKEKVFAWIGAFALAALGLLEGFAFATCGICDPRVFRDQMEFKTFLLLKLFLSGVACSMLAQSVMSLLAKDAFAKSRFYTNLAVPFKRAIPGCTFLGVGMYLAGSGPTITPSQLGSGVGSAPFVIAGMAIGGFTFSLVEKTGIFSSSIPKPESTKETSLDTRLGVPYAAVAVPGGILLLVVAVVFEVIFPHAADVQHYSSTSTTPWSLNPIVAGLVIGINQVPIRFLYGDGQGGSTAIMNIIGTVSCGVLSPNQRVTKIEDTYQFFYVYVGTTLGALTAAQSFPGYQAAEGYGIAVTIIGAAVMFFGARFAHGCTCGHGISGMSELSASSIAAGMCIFGGGIIAGVVNVFLVQPNI